MSEVEAKCLSGPSHLTGYICATLASNHRGNRSSFPSQGYSLYVETVNKWIHTDWKLEFKSTMQMLHICIDKCLLGQVPEHGTMAYLLHYVRLCEVCTRHNSAHAHDGHVAGSASKVNWCSHYWITFSAHSPRSTILDAISILVQMLCHPICCIRHLT